MKLTRFLLLVLFGFSLLAGCGRDTDTHDADRRQDIDSELIRAEGTNVAALDTNNDGVVYQCPMDYQVISSSMETCPICLMELEEYTVSEAQRNLESHYQQQ
jgi:nitrous oxide reductase accessory protein NosL